MFQLSCQIMNLFAPRLYCISSEEEHYNWGKYIRGICIYKYGYFPCIHSRPIVSFTYHNTFQKMFTKEDLLF